MFNKKMVEVLQFAVLILTAVYFVQAIYVTHHKRKETAPGA